MVLTTQFVFSLVIALGVSLIVSRFLRRQAPRIGFFFFFLMLFLLVLAGGLWIRPFGPTFYGVFWLPLVIVGLFAGLFLYHSTPDRLPRNRREKIQTRTGRDKTVTGGNFTENENPAGRVSSRIQSCRATGCYRTRHISSLYGYKYQNS